MWIILSALLVFLLLAYVYIDYFYAPQNIVPGVSILPFEIEKVFPIEDLKPPSKKSMLDQDHTTPFPQKLAVEKESVHEQYSDTDLYPGSSIVTYKSIKGRPILCMKEIGGLYAHCRKIVYDDMKKDM